MVNFTPEELKGFDVEKLIGAPALLAVVHNRTPDRTYVNIKSIQRLPKGMEKPEPPDGYVRVKDRPPLDGEGEGHSREPGEDDDLDPIPF